jgi:DNA-directed RNA polymerase subunit M/transcription elongation factor TFIIS
MNIQHTVLQNLRNIKYRLLLNTVQDNEFSSNYDDIEVEKMVTRLEQICYDYANKAIEPSTEGLSNRICEEIYHLKVGRCVGFLEDGKSFDKILKKIMDGEILLDQLLDVNVIELFPERYPVQLARIEETSKEMEVKYSALYYCHKCKQNKCIAQRAQTRSCDEGMNIFLTCQCGHVFNG